MMFRHLGSTGGLLIAVLSIACSSAARYPIASGPRDWSAHPAVVELEIDAGATIFAISDVHGGYDRMVALFAKHHLIDAFPSSPGAIHWTGGDAVLVVAGDMIDKGAQSLEVLDALMALEQSAADQGGRIVVTLGNHEAEFFVDPTNSKASTFDHELTTDHLMPMAVADGSDSRGKWLRERPFAVRVGSWFFSHAGDTHGRSVAALEQALRAAVETNDYDDPELVGAHSILESQDWFVDDGSMGLRYAHAVGAEHIVFGHSPHSIGPEGAIATGQNGALFRIDCGMSPAVDFSAGVLLRVRRENGQDVAEALSADGSVQKL
jgi:hypothetical protein